MKKKRKKRGFAFLHVHCSKVIAHFVGRKKLQNFELRDNERRRVRVYWARTILNPSVRPAGKPNWFGRERRRVAR